MWKKIIEKQETHYFKVIMMRGMIKAIFKLQVDAIDQSCFELEQIEDHNLFFENFSNLFSPLRSMCFFFFSSLIFVWDIKTATNLYNVATNVYNVWLFSHLFCLGHKNNVYNVWLPAYATLYNCVNLAKLSICMHI